MWPEMIQFDEVKARLIGEGVPVERVLAIHSELRFLPLGARYLIERPEGDLALLAQGTGWYKTEAVA
jgi:hypothetical protein